MNSITLWYKVRRLQKAIDATYKEYQKMVKKGRAEKQNQEYFAEINADYSFESQNYDDDIMELTTRYLRSKALKLLLPLPDHQDDSLWEESNFTGRRNLTNKGITELRSTIRKELHERRIGVLSWVAALTGLVGTLTGLIAIIGKSL